MEHLEYPWIWDCVSLNNIIPDFLLNNLNLPWDWSDLSVNPSIPWSFILSHPNLPWEWKRLSGKENYINKSPSTSDLIEKDKQFGNKLLYEFLKDNRDLKTAFSMTTSINMLQKFQAVKGLSEVGDIKNVKKLIENTAIDDIFTQERKDKYVLMCANYLGS